MTSLEVQDIARKISLFYLNKKKNPYLANEEIAKIGISSIEIKSKIVGHWFSKKFQDDVVIITCARPGLLIGRKGSNIEELQSFLQKKISIIEDKDSIFIHLDAHQYTPLDY
jgi:ribosomal protein S3